MRLTPKSPDRKSYRYELLPAAEHGVKPVAGRKTFSYRRWLRLVAVAASALAMVALIARSYRKALPAQSFPDPATLPPELLPPLYGRFHEAELQLPQHQPDYPLAEGRKYFHYNNSVLCAYYLLGLFTFAERPPQTPDGAMQCKSCYCSITCRTVPVARKHPMTSTQVQCLKCA